MPPLVWDRRPEGLRAPALICAFRGWNDAAESASEALTFFGSQIGAQRFAAIDPEDFFDFQAVRPQVEIVDGRTRELTWPANEFYDAEVPRASRDLVLMSGIEPSHRWRTFTQTIIDLAESLGVQLVVTLGALLADTPHTRPVRVTGLASDDRLLDRLAISSASYEGPTGIVGVLHSACADAGIPTCSLWAPVPHYVGAAPNPKAALALVRALEGVVGIPVDGGTLEVAAGEYERQVDLAVRADPEVQAFVERLEHASDVGEESPFDPTRLPSGDAIARDLQRFLRQRDQ